MNAIPHIYQIGIWFKITGFGLRFATRRQAQMFIDGRFPKSV